MITEALQHCVGVGPVRLAQLHELGLHNWLDVVRTPWLVPESIRETVVDECHRCLAALARRDTDFLIQRIAVRDRWRILAEFIHEASFFDVETTGLEYEATITVIICWHDGKLHQFVEDENLDDFLDLLDEIQLLVSFNGSSFDVPRVLDSFHIPELPCPHLDLRWPCYHHGYRGSLKKISDDLGLERPDDLQDADGALAIQLWEAWQQKQCVASRNLLLRYCAADVLLLRYVAHRVAGVMPLCQDQLWQALPTPASAVRRETSGGQDPALPLTSFNTVFGEASPSRLRARRKKLGA